MSNEKAVSRLNEIILRKQNEIAALRIAQDELADPIWDQRDRDDAYDDLQKMATRGLVQVNEAERQAAVHKENCICPACMPDHPNHFHLKIEASGDRSVEMNSKPCPSTP